MTGLFLLLFQILSKYRSFQRYFCFQLTLHIIYSMSAERNSNQEEEEGSGWGAWSSWAAAAVKNTTETFSQQDWVETHL